MIIKNGKVVLAGGIRKADILIEEGRIGGIGKFDAKERGEECIDAQGLLVFAGFVDAHVHLRDPEDTRKEDFSSGTAAALAGGFTGIIDMPNYRNPATTTKKALEEKRRIAARKARCNYSFHFGAAENNFEEVRKANPASLKIFLSDTKSELWVKSDESLRRHLEGFPKERPVLVHAEDEEAIRQGGRDIGAEIAGMQRVGRIVARMKRRVHFCHLSSGQEVALAKKFGRRITCEVTPHHLFLCERDAQRNPLAGMNPPLRSATQVEGLWKVLGNVDMIASDHAPHTLENKKDGAAGVPGLETSVSLMLDAAAKKRISYTRIAQLMCENPCSVFGMRRRGKLEKGYYADVTIVDPKEEWVVDASKLYTKCGWSPFEGKRLKGKVKYAIVNGRIAYGEGEVRAKEGDGREVERKY